MKKQETFVFSTIFKLPSKLAIFGSSSRTNRNFYQMELKFGLIIYIYWFAYFVIVVFLCGKFTANYCGAQYSILMRNDDESQIVWNCTMIRSCGCWCSCVKSIRARTVYPNKYCFVRSIGLVSLHLLYLKCLFFPVDTHAKMFNDKWKQQKIADKNRPTHSFKANERTQLLLLKHWTPITSTCGVCQCVFVINLYSEIENESRFVVFVIVSFFIWYEIHTTELSIALNCASWMGLADYDKIKPCRNPYT